MKPVSNKRQRRNRETKPARDAYRAENPWCQWCCNADATELHEIARGPSRDKSLSERAAWLHLCRQCHQVIALIPVDGQLAIKRISDPDGYDRVTVNRLRGREDEAINDDEVSTWSLRFTMLPR